MVILNHQRIVFQATITKGRARDSQGTMRTFFMET